MTQKILAKPKDNTNMTMENTDWNALRDRAYECAKAHGWHDEEHNVKHYLMFVVTELAEAVQADRKGRHADRQEFEEFMAAHDETALEYAYTVFIAGTVEDEFADVIIRCLDFAGLTRSDLSKSQDLLDFIENGKKDTYKLFGREFTEIAYELTDLLLHWGDYRDAIVVVMSTTLEWGEYLGIDMMWHIKQKMKYNETRPYKHGKRY